MFRFLPFERLRVKSSLVASQLVQVSGRWYSVRGALNNCALSFFAHFVAIVEYIIMTNHHQQRGQSGGGVKVWPEISHPWNVIAHPSGHPRTGKSLLNLNFMDNTLFIHGSIFNHHAISTIMQWASPFIYFYMSVEKRKQGWSWERHKGKLAVWLRKKNY